MRCLLILPRPIFPLVCGYALKNYNLIQILAKKYELKLVIISDRELDLQEISFYQSLSIEYLVHLIPKWKSYLHAAMGVFSRLPLQVCYYYDRALQRKVDLYLDSCQILISALVRTRMYLRKAELMEGKTIVFDMVDSIALNYERSQSKTSSYFWRMIYGIEGKRLKKYERKCIENSSITYLFNQEEVTYWSQYGNIKWLPHGVNDKLFLYNKKEQSLFQSVVFIGKMDYQPNIDAVIWYLEHVHAKIGERIPFVIVGAYPVERVLECTGKYPNVTVTGFVEDPYVYVASAMAVVAPMQTGGGIQNKVLEGMALGKVNIVSSLAARPIVGAEDGVHLLIADTPEEYISYLEELNDEKDCYRKIGENARELIARKFTWEAYGEEYIKGLN